MLLDRWVAVIAIKCPEKGDLQGKPLSKEDAATIHSLLETTTDRKAVIFCIAMCFKKLPLCKRHFLANKGNNEFSGEAKIQLLELGCNVASEWLTKKDALESVRLLKTSESRTRNFPKCLDRIARILKINCSITASGHDRSRQHQRPVHSAAGGHRQLQN